MHLLTVEGASVFNGTISSPIADRGESTIGNSIGNWPVRQYDGLESRQPVQAASRHRTIWLANACSDRHKMAVSGKAHVNALCGMPKLGEAGIQVEIDPAWNTAGQLLVGEQPRDIYEYIRSSSDFFQAIISHAHRLLGAGKQQRRILLQAKLRDHLAKIPGINGGLQGRRDRSKRR